MTEKAIEKTENKKPEEEEEDDEKKTLKAINEKYKDNLTIKLKLLALFNYSKIESENSEKMEKEINVVTQKYKKLSLPLINKVNDIVNGKKLESEDLHNHEQYLGMGEAEKKDEIITKEPKVIQDYWLKVLKGNFALKEEIKEYDEAPLKALRRIEYFPSEDTEKPHDFTLKFHFAPNDYFENDVLIKEFQMEDEREAKKTECTEVKWKEGKNVTKKTKKKKQKNKKTGQSRTVVKETDQESFFTFFRNMENKEHNCEDHDEDEHDDEAEEMDHIDRHVDIAQTLIEEILPYSSEYYLGVRKEADFGFLKDQLMGGMGAGGDDDDDDDDDDAGKKKGKKGKKGGAGGAAGDKQECKQQ
mmetsp:Transcript_62917/g.73208  ORF Transcript_62917/g.73208 Transcript_62917/m.73208 type:complete len:358 (+) Transcript_62917:37-1110(+)|eukprot:CAMPEP_0176448700 /NCGR_PEP_ID=MMETSP0127-20121128/25972_1 /TAXON_ID=938130 /ORGANISM="Platyophrya macrostoma, Strain WH" /LENGTH=357 /DNA_ID=CAMNT_0017835765 /DNA_START=42 /DNA_END=1115 /DNA_ORIENTATION=+